MKSQYPELLDLLLKNGASTGNGMNDG